MKTKQKKTAGIGKHGHQVGRPHGKNTYAKLSQKKKDLLTTEEKRLWINHDRKLSHGNKSAGKISVNNKIVKRLTKIRVADKLSSALTDKTERPVIAQKSAKKINTILKPLSKSEANKVNRLSVKQTPKVVKSTLNGKTHVSLIGAEARHRETPKTKSVITGSGANMKVDTSHSKFKTMLNSMKKYRSALNEGRQTHFEYIIKKEKLPQELARKKAEKHLKKVQALVKQHTKGKGKQGKTLLLKTLAKYS